jgi:hypothetical protein
MRNYTAKIKTGYIYMKHYIFQTENTFGKNVCKLQVGAW